jgi:3-oxoacyl-[acyl-carrier-protein] synthase II
LAGVERETFVEKVVVTGTGMVTSLGVTAAETFNALSAGYSGIRAVSGVDTEGFACRMGAQVRHMDPSDMGIHPRDARIMRLQGLMLMKASRDALVIGDLDPLAMDASSVGLFVGMGYMDYEFEELLMAARVCRNHDGSFNHDAFFSRGYQEIHPLWPLSILNNMTLCQVAISLGIKGENAVFAPCGDAGAWAVAEGAHAIREGKADVVLAGGVSDRISPLSLARSLTADWLTTDPPLMRNACSPSSPKGEGVILGEGCGVMVLESSSGAEKRGAPLLAEVSGFGSAFEREMGGHWPTDRAIERAMEKAMADAGIDPTRVDLVIAHGDGTAGDRNENDAICRLLSDAGKPIDAYASKGALGDLLAASPVVDAILGICMMQNGIIPEALSMGPLEDHGPSNLSCKSKAMQKSPEHVLINTRSYQGQCVSLVITACR